MSKIKKILTSLVVVFVLFCTMIAFSLKGERDYLENCRTLSIKCEPGRIHQTIDKISKWIFPSTQNSELKQVTSTPDEQDSLKSTKNK